MLRTVIVVIALHLVGDCYGADPPRGVHFLGKGYNLVTGNPEGNPGVRGGVDPGIRDTHSILKMTYDTNRLSDDHRFKVPDEVQYGPRSVCTATSEKDVVSDAKSYQNSLSVGVEGSYGGEYGLASVAFSASAKYAQMNKETSDSKNVFYQSREECNYGTARLRMEAAPHENFVVSNSFRYAVCNLLTNRDTNKYNRFFDTWGTHYIRSVTLGTRVTKRYKESESSFLSFVQTEVSSAISASVSSFGHSGRLAVDMDTVRNSVKSGSKFGSKSEEITAGSKDNPEPIHVKIESIDKAVNDMLFKNNKCPGVSSMSVVAEAIRNAFSKYPAWKQVQEPNERKMFVPIAWPKGTYGLPMTNSGCPRVGTWSTGWRYHDTEDDDSSNYWSSPLHWPSGSYGKNNLKQHFCMKTDAGGFMDWPKGEYCIFKLRSCPRGFKEGNIYWDDEDDDNQNKHGGYLPSMNTGRNTRIYYCCRDDGFAPNAISLPTSSPFYLFAKKGTCQQVKGMRVNMEYMRFDNEDDDNEDSVSGSYPYGAGGPNHKIWYCYYH